MRTDWRLSSFSPISIADSRGCRLGFAPLVSPGISAALFRVVANAWKSWGESRGSLRQSELVNALDHPIHFELVVPSSPT